MAAALARQSLPRVAVGIGPVVFLWLRSSRVNPCREQPWVKCQVSHFYGCELVLDKADYWCGDWVFLFFRQLGLVFFWRQPGFAFFAGQLGFPR